MEHRAKKEIIKVWGYKHVQCAIMEVDIGWDPPPSLLIKRKYLLGYVALPGLEVQDFDSIPSSVHGGISWSNQEEGAAIYGFDTNHASDKSTPETFSIDWVAAETRRLADELIQYFNYELIQYFNYQPQMEQHGQEQRAEKGGGGETE